MRCGRLRLCAARCPRAVPSAAAAAAELRALLDGPPPPRGLSCAALVACVAAMELRRQTPPAAGLFAEETAPFLWALCGIGRGECGALAEQLWATASENVSDAQRVVVAARELLTGIDAFGVAPRENDDAATGGLARLEMNLLEIIARHEGAVIGDVAEVCYVLQHMYNRLTRMDVPGDMSAAERRKWIRRIRQLTTVMYFRLSDCSAEELDMFKRTLRCIYGVGTDSSARFGYINKIRYGAGVLIPYFFRNTAALKALLVKFKEQSSNSNIQRDTPTPKSNTQKVNHVDDKVNKMTLAFVLLGGFWYMLSAVFQPLTPMSQNEN